MHATFPSDKPRLLAGIGILCSLHILFTAVPACAFQELSSPSLLPVDLEAEKLDSWQEWREMNGGSYSDWIGIYYAEGTGLELQITCQYLRGADCFPLDENGKPFITVTLNNYDLGQTILSERIYESGTDEYITSDAGITLTRSETQQIQVSFSSDQIISWNCSGIYLYKGLTSAKFTDVELLEETPVKDNWTGTYLDDTTEASCGTSALYSFKQLYGTNDYVCYSNLMTHGDETGSFYHIYTERSNKLVHACPSGPSSSETAYICYEKTDNSALCRPVSAILESQLDAPFDSCELAGIYQQISKHPLWEDEDCDGYFW